LRGLRPIFARVEFGQRLSLPDRLVLAHEHALDIAGDLWRDDDRIRCDISVIGALHILAAILIIEVPQEASGKDCESADEQRQPDARRLERGTL